MQTSIAAGRGAGVRWRRLLSSWLLAAAALGTAGCGLVSKDVPIVSQLTIGGFPPNPFSLGASSITTPLQASAGDLSKLSSVTLSWATLATTDDHDLSFITGGSITVSGNNLPTVELAKLGPPGVVGTVNYTIENSTDLRAYLEAGGQISVAINYNEPAPVPARGLQLTLNIHATL